MHLDPACHDVGVACDDVAQALQLLRHAMAVEWASEAADAYLVAVREALNIVLRAQVLVERAHLAVREHATATARERATVPWLEAGAAPICRATLSAGPFAEQANPW